MAGVIGAMTRFRKVEEACSSKDEAPPMYLFLELEHLANESNDAARSVAEHVVRNLQDKRPVVKWKVGLCRSSACPETHAEQGTAINMGSTQVSDGIGSTGWTGLWH